ncbi:MAG: hypothetical protein WCO60_06570 [Verrucomicrobiota bacterium]
MNSNFGGDASGQGGASEGSVYCGVGQLGHSGMPRRFAFFYELQAALVSLVRKRAPDSVVASLRYILKAPERFAEYRYYVLRLVWMTRKFDGDRWWAQSCWLVSRLWGYHFGSRTVVCSPEIPKLNYILRKLIMLCGARPTTNVSPKGKRIAFYWIDSTKNFYPSELLAAMGESKVINGGCIDISKMNVEAVFCEVFGYSGFVDPQVHQGLAVEKGDDNALHDGRVVQCPVDNPILGKVYMRLIDNAIDSETVEDLRVPFFGDNIPFVYVKYRPMNERFGIANSSVRIVETRDVFSRQEMARINTFCRSFPVEYGELDVLRDRKNGRIYIVDVNKTPGGFADSLSYEDEVDALRRLWHAFTRTFLRSGNTRDTPKSRGEGLRTKISQPAL